jgi:hypothetical protein
VCRGNALLGNRLQIRITYTSTKKIWVMTSAEALGYCQNVPPGLSRFQAT